MKKILSLILAALLLCSALVACSPAANNSNEVSSEEKRQELESVISVTSSNYQINNAKISFFFNALYKSDLKNYSSYLTALGLDTTKPLKDQKYGEGTWYDFYMEAALSQLKASVIFSELANEKGITLTAEEKAAIDSYIQDLKTEAATKGETFESIIEFYFGQGVTEATVRECFEMQELSFKAYTAHMDALTFEDAEYEKYYSEHSDDFIYVDYYLVDLSITIPEDATTEEVDALKAGLVADKDALIAAKTEEEFRAAYTDYLKKLYAGNDAKTDLVIKGEVDDALVYELPVSNLSSLGFDANAEYKEGLSAVAEGTNRYTIYFIANDPTRSEYNLRNIRHIMLTPSQYETEEAAREKAVEILTEYLEGEQTAEAFGALANKYSADSSSNTNGGLYENVPKDYFHDASFNDWIYDPERVEGDTGIVGTTSGYHVMYFAGETSPKWYLEVEYALKEQAYLELIDELTEKYAYTENKENINKFEA